METKQEYSSKGARDVLAERARQITKEGYTKRHDAEHNDGSLAAAAACYIIHNTPAQAALRWPWEPASFKPASRRKDLVRAAALLVAEIDRLDVLKTH